ncbi:reverse transcriptase [Plasmopara halstedii]|uniref:Reverse transcriptase n=1 Tax=Plasmopara halstedii TaxID=4781 RepID=A0A0P1B1C9_PLAHL|nr:reverse transcriptase [Plasmopara halstedii]CEG47142.1 reverse transcriptase [Plasmopara halstedii]|eukprot:XP_024583511.1 reverse transcriptase [Plasmopara halstedii]
MTVEDDGDVTLEATSAVDAFLELDELSFKEFDGILKAGDLAMAVIIRPYDVIKSFLLLDEAVLEASKKALNARSGSSILRNPLDPYHPLVKEFQNVVSEDPPSVIPPDRGVRHEIDLVLGTNTA